VASLATCAIAACGTAESPATTSAVTYVEHVAPILERHCVTCHRPGQGAPFTLLTYADARDQAADIATVTSAREMPPWLPASGPHPFVGRRGLAEGEIALLRAWADAGAPEGAPSRGSLQAPTDTDRLGEPDLVLTPAVPYTLTPGSTDVFRNLVIRTGLTEDRHVRAVEFRPGDAAIHHAVVHLDGTSGSRRRDGADGVPGFDGMGALGTVEPEGHFIGWAPGRGPIVSAPGRPWRLDRGTDLVLELHLIPQTASVRITPSIAIYFDRAPEAAPPLMFKMGSKAIDILPGVRDYAITDRYVMPVDATLLSVYPHAHRLGRSMRLDATFPNGTTQALMEIPEWDFHWQQDYRYETPVVLPRGTTLAMRFTYDNTTHPPRRVLAGPRSEDEMGNLLLQLVPASAGDRARLVADAATREARANVEAGEMLVRYFPQSAEHLTHLGASYVEVGRVSEGLATLERARGMAPQAFNTRNELGGALLKSGRARESAAEFAAAAALHPNDAFVQYNLARALLAAGNAEEGRAALDRALAINPDFAEAHNELGVWWFSRGRLTEALVHLQRAAALAPRSSLILSDLGGALAQAGRRVEAQTYLERALALDPTNEAARQNLARVKAGR
jgi:Flp pilus assembly protein TadD